jgi:2-polyprenyl-3-methyl-5-hydroxy-6-metoxy-1,4-benzoquinol methylase
MKPAREERAMDAERAESFAARVRTILDGGALALLFSIGHRTGLFDVLASMPPAPSAAIAREAGLDERYVREWLNALVAGGVLALHEERGLYFLPADFAASLTRAAGVNNLAATAQWIALLGEAEDELVDAFATGGGVAASCYRRFRKVIAEDSGLRAASLLASDLLPLVPGLTSALEKGLALLDVGCGSGALLLELAQRFPRSRFTGADLSVEAIKEARRGAAALRLANLRFEICDANYAPPEARFDCITAFGVIHRVQEPTHTLGLLAQALRAGGALLLQEEASSGSPLRDAARPLAAFSYARSCLHSVATTRAAGASAAGAMWGAVEARRALEAAGFHHIEEKQIARDPRSMYFVARSAGRRLRLT